MFSSRHVNYKAQTLYAAPGPSGLTQIQPIPNIAGPVAIYLDVWERLITSQEDPSQVLPGLGTESAARMRREWCVRTRQGTAPPVVGNADYVAGHSYALLATLNRKMSGANPAPIAQGDIADARHGHLTLASVETRLARLEKLLLTPSFNASPNQFNPKLGAPATQVTLFGANLNLGSVTVQFGATAAALTGQQSNGQLNVLVPSMPAGLVPITVQTAGGIIVTGDTFDVLPPPPPQFAASPNQFNPKLGSKGVATQVTLFGSHFNQPPVSVTINGQAAPIVGSISDTQLTVSVGPVAATGAFTFHLQNAAGAADTTDTFTFTP